MTLPKCLRPYADMIESVSDERDTEDGYWIYLVAGYWSPDDETHCIHEENPRECVAKLKSVEPCPRTPSHDGCHC